MTIYDKQFKKETVKLSNGIGVRKAAKQLGISYNTLIERRRKQTQHGEDAHIGSEQTYSSIDKSKREIELEQENSKLRRANEILKDALGFLAKDR